VFFLVFTVRGIAHFSGRHFALVMTILIGVRILLQAVFAAAGKLGFFKQTGAPGKQQAKIRDKWDLEEVLLASTKDEALTGLLVGVMEQVGRDGYVSVERGGSGNPYETEYRGEPEGPKDPRKPSEIQAECEKLHHAWTLSKDDSERDRIERRLAELAGDFCTIRINVASSEEFDRQKKLITDARTRLRQIAGNTE